MTTSSFFDSSYQLPDQERTTTLATEVVSDFKRVTRRYALFHFSFLSLGLVELFSFVLFFSFLTQSTLLAFSLAGLVLTLFTYFILYFYLQAKKATQLLDLKQTFLTDCQGLISEDTPSLESHLFLARSLYKVYEELQGLEKTYYPLPESFQTLCPLFKKMSLLIHWKDVHLMQEILLERMARAHIERIKVHPTAPLTHAGLASVYLLLARLYLDPRKKEEKPLWVSPEYGSTEMKEKFRHVAQKAIEELLIVKHYVPQDLWVYEQLASIYHDLEDAEKEITCYEKMHILAPEDHEILFRLGALYFLLGRNAQGLEIYESLIKRGNPQARDLLKFYDTEVL